MTSRRTGRAVRTALLACIAALGGTAAVLSAAGPATASLRSGGGKVVSGGAAYSRCDKTVTTDVARLVNELNDEPVFDNDIVDLDLKFGTGSPEMELISQGVMTYLQGGEAATKDYLTEGCALLAHVVIQGSATTTTTPTHATFTPPSSQSATGSLPHVEILSTTGGVSGVESAVNAYLSTLGGSVDATPGTLACAGPPSLKDGTDLLCNWLQGNGLGAWSYAIATKANATRILLIASPQIECSKLSSGQTAAVEAWSETKTCTSPEGIYMPTSDFSANLPGNSSALSDDSLEALASGDTALPSAATACGAGSAVAVRVDPQDNAWVAWYYYAEGASSGDCPSVGGLAHEVDGTWKVVSGPVFDLACGAPASVPASVLRALGASKTCPPTPARFGANFSTTTTTTQPAAGGDGQIAALANVLQAFFASGCDGGCTEIQEPASYFTTEVDPQDPTWAKWTIDDPNFGGAAGYAQEVNGNWNEVGGLGTGGLVGCGTVPDSVLAYFVGSPVSC